MGRKVWDAIIVGGGPAGLSAALMLGRARRRVLVIDAGSPRNRFASHMHGVLGHEGAAPGELLERGRAEAAGYGVEIVTGSVTAVERAENGLHVTADDGVVRFARAVIAAAGLRDELPGVPGLAERWGATVLHCPYCHGWEVRDQHLGVLTTSPMALHQAELVRQWSERVTVFAHGLGDLAPETAQRLRARGIRLEHVAVTEVVGDGTAIAAVRLDDGREVQVDAIFTAGEPRAHEHFLTPLELAHEDTPFGPVLAVDQMGRTSDQRVWAVGNVASPFASVPQSIGAGSSTGAAVNAALVTWDFDDAVAGSAAGADEGSVWPQVAPAEFWEDRYAASERVWSGRVNRILAEVAVELAPGRALDLGCGEGADVIWLAQHGWKATGVDISSMAITRAIATAEELGVDGRARFLTADIAEPPVGEYDLVSVSYLHSPTTLDREEILRRATALVAPGGHLLITAHTGFPEGVEVPAGHQHRFPTPEEELAQLELDPQRWDVIRAEASPREEPGLPGDGVVLVRRR
ncbi:bifunctional NAD(P)/FAD-dependent oxidoreductase/class I SAM-dependent methyltransferase [Microbacterium sp. ARD32]|uniref:bifunctional NAD(P)/FAD-dependent oxidoreductase/class I SAM-dependent methyltransferase n=1 Tax=Microbacterium sp. ARD32 TaxID=2962577 RepID=UPI0028818673|nr:bifunctional NAD(P)/FAD-dependent oxidoreductase/class I SAM-dependent methyltransferase [Microbacterium sp. ARD32]MDT0158756.1 bifunctional NAD(P)/FAD-dependent oxidoreductase/class I SAM-dependent methyltransferase [Microbacterium sp. ARD32]